MSSSWSKQIGSQFDQWYITPTSRETHKRNDSITNKRSNSKMEPTEIWPTHEEKELWNQMQLQAIPKGATPGWEWKPDLMDSAYWAHQTDVSEWMLFKRGGQITNTDARLQIRLNARMLGGRMHWIGKCAESRQVGYQEARQIPHHAIENRKYTKAIHNGKIAPGNNVKHKETCIIEWTV